jgi:uncharacterized protein (DUF1778 family)
MARDQVLQLQASAEQRQLIDQAAAAEGISRTECILRSCQERGRDVLLDRPLVSLTPEQTTALLADLEDPGAAALDRWLQQRALVNAALGSELGLTASEAHAAVERAVAARLAVKDEAGKPSVVRAALRAFVVHGARYCFPATQGGLSRGVLTGYAATPLSEQIQPGNDPPRVWPWKKGTERGIAFHPLYPSVPEAAERNPALGELLALFDAVRGGSAREQALALALLEERLQP